MGDFFEELFARGNSYWLTRFIILRLLGFVYAIAFLIAAQQLVPLIGEHGLTPANHFLTSIQTQLGSRMAGMFNIPTLFWFGISDNALSIFAWIGLGLSLVVLGGYANAIILTVLWAMYMSIVHIGQVWYGYGWEIQLLETGFLSIFLCPLLDGRPFPKCRPPIFIGRDHKRLRLPVGDEPRQHVEESPHRVHRLAIRCLEGADRNSEERTEHEARPIEQEPVSCHGLSIVSERGNRTLDSREAGSTSAV